jgi:hypothetical protein
MLTFDTVRSIDATADGLEFEDERLELRRLATLVSCVVSAQAAMQRSIAAFGNSERGTYGAGYADGATLANDMILIVNDALAAYVDTQVTL